MIRNHVAWSQDFAAGLAAEDDFEIVTGPILSLFTFRFAPPSLSDDQIDALNETLVAALNDAGRIYVTHTTHQERLVIRFQVGQTDSTQEDVRLAGQVTRNVARSLPRGRP